MSNLNGIIQLNDFVQEGLHWLFVKSEGTLLHLHHERAIINVWPLNSWEQVRDNVFKQWDIIFQELGHIYVSEGS